MKKMKILFNGLGPNDTITHEGKIYVNGSVADVDEKAAKAYLDAHLAAEITSDVSEEAVALQKLEIKNAKKRKEVQAKAIAAENGEMPKTEE